MITKSIKIVTTGIMLSIVTTAAHAVAPGFYLGAQLGMTNLHNKPQTILIDTSNPSAPAVLTSPSNTGLGARIFMGYKINLYSAIEVGITHYASSSYNAKAPNFANQDVNLEENGGDLVGIGMFPLPYGFGVFGKAGISGMAIHVPTSILDSGISSGYARPIAGFGVSYDMSQNWVIDLSFSRVFASGQFQNADFLALGISWHLVDKMCGQFLC